MTTRRSAKAALAAAFAVGAALSLAASAEARGGRHGGHGHYSHGHTLQVGNAAIRPSGVVPSSQICSWQVRMVYGEPRAVRVCDSLAY